jgi:hypothetical protein
MKLPKIAPYLVLVCLGLSGCTVLSNLDELSVLGGYSREKDNQHRLVKSIDDYYDTLIKTIDQKHINDYKDESSFTHSFGEPILKKELSDGTQRWLYRYAIYKSAKDKVYVYFDRNGRMIRWERLPCPKLF